MRPLLAAAVLVAALAATSPASSQPILGVQGNADRFAADLARLGLPAVDGDLPVTTPKLRMVWNPQGRAGPVWDLASKPASQAAYRTLITPLG